AQRVRFADGPGTTLCDVNGDRLLDFCLLRSESLVYWLGRGRGRFEPARDASGVPAFDSASPWQLHDLDGDGWVDLVHVGVTQVEYALGAGGGIFEPVRVLADVPAREPGATIEFADMNGSGTIDVVWVDPPGSAETAWRYLELFPEGRAGLLSRIDNGLGKVVSIRYEPAAASAARARESGTPWTTRMNVGMPVVQRVALDSSLGDPPQAAEYSYRDGTWDPLERTFAGFAGGLATELGDEFTPTLVLDETFDTGLDNRALRGARLSSERRAANGDVLMREAHGYTSSTVARGLDGTELTYAYRSSLRVEHIEQASGLPPRETLSEWLHDEYGNVLEERRWGEVTAGDTSVGSDEAITVRSYANDAEGWRLGYPVSEEVRDAAGQRFSAQRWYYDGEPFIGLAPGEIERGNVTRQEIWIGPGPDEYVLDTATRYDEHGQPLETRDARGGGRIFEWRAEDPASLKSERVKLESGVELVEQAEIDPRFGNLLSLVEYNGQTTRFQYDALGRLSAIVKPGDADDEPTLSYEYQLTAPLSRVITRARAGDTANDIEHSETLFDGLGRERASLTRADEGRWVLAGVDLLDVRGNPRRRLRPRFVAEAAVASPPLLDDAPGVSLWHDALDREIRARSELGIEQRIVHGPLVTHTWDGAQNDPSSPYEHTPTVEERDGLGGLVRAARTFENRELSAHFRYDPLGQLQSKTDPEGNVARYEYDGRGNHTTIDEPDLGLRRLVYDDTGNLIERHNPDGSVLRYTFDLAGRPLSEDWDGDGAPEVEKRWDIQPEQPDDSRYRGKLARIEDPTGITDHVYDERGRVIETTLELAGQRYTSGSRFDGLDREVLHVYPDGSSLRIHRNPRGQLAGYGDALRIEYDGDGLELERRFNTGALQQSAYDADRRHDELVALAADGSTIEHVKWRFDGAGN
ncbi:MAG: toxin TcdB middle/N-terminal domain-containing protein, partial [Polyangiaceae bacterium]